MYQESLNIESKDLSIEDLYKDFYTVPDFQREFVWERAQVKKLLQDVHDEFYDEGGQLIKGPEHFLGSIVVCRTEDGTFYLIDGQPCSGESDRIRPLGFRNNRETPSNANRSCRTSMGHASPAAYIRLRRGGARPHEKGGVDQYGNPPINAIKCSFTMSNKELCPWMEANK